MNRKVKIKQLEEACRAQSLPLTVQRRAVLSALAEREDHPTADQMYEAVRPRLPGISRATVYRVLDTLVRLGVAQKTSHTGSAARFDPNTSPHHHLICSLCGRVADWEGDVQADWPRPQARRRGFRVTGYSISFQGVCAPCQASSEKLKN